MNINKINNLAVAQMKPQLKAREIQPKLTYATDTVELSKQESPIVLKRQGNALHVSFTGKIQNPMETKASEDAPGNAVNFFRLPTKISISSSTFLFKRIISPTCIVAKSLNETVLFPNTARIGILAFSIVLSITS